MAGRSQLVARELAEQLPSLAQAVDDDEFLAEASRCLAQVHGHLGEFVAANRYMAEAMKINCWLRATVGSVKGLIRQTYSMLALCLTT